MTDEAAGVCVYIGEALGSYGFGDAHPFSRERLDVFTRALAAAGLDQQVRLCKPVKAERATIERFHSAQYVNRVIHQSATGEGFLDFGDTPAFPGIFDAASFVVGSTLNALDKIMHGSCRRAFVPIAGLHHARRDSAAGFCVFNDCGVAIETLLSMYGQTRIAYVDIDAHHGDGVFYAFEDNPSVFFADLHEDGRYLFPGTGGADETGRGKAAGTKLNIPMPPYSTDEEFMQAWDRVEAFLHEAQPSFILLQCGADSLAGDPITHMQYSAAAHAHAATQLCKLADQYCEGRVLAMGGGGYNHNNIARAWTAVVRAFVGNL
ncbi:MAG: acetoin utilization protein AcuC [Gammaproteobacteria bacterium]|nr:acetoin utilization protein AcuC [Gammaproteobacteria bacterium]MCI0591701.1 acetoin utilization protein AcuC [Gammaproteobacteria bacterium]